MLKKNTLPAMLKPAKRSTKNEGRLRTKVLVEGLFPRLRWYCWGFTLQLGRIKQCSRVVTGKNHTNVQKMKKNLKTSHQLRYHYCR